MEISEHDETASLARYEHGLIALREVVTIAMEAGVTALPVKGIVTGALLYESAGERFIRDVDLRVEPASFARLTHALRAAGYTQVSASRAYADAIFVVRGMPVEIETHVSAIGLVSTPVRTLIARGVEAPGDFGVRCLVPELHDHALLLVANAYKDKIFQAHRGAVEDLRRIVRARDFDPQTLAERAREGHACLITWVTANVLAHETGDARWREIAERLDRSLPRRRHAERVLRAIETREASTLRGALLVRAGSDRRIDAVHALFRMGGWALEQRGRRG